MLYCCNHNHSLQTKPNQTTGLHWYILLCLPLNNILSMAIKKIISHVSSLLSGTVMVVIRVDAFKPPDEEKRNYVQMQIWRLTRTAKCLADLPKCFPPCYAFLIFVHWNVVKVKKVCWEQGQVRIYLCLLNQHFFQSVFSSLAFYSMHTDALVNSMGYTNATLLGNPVSSLISGGIICGFHECL